jgi:N-acetylglucosaminyl-diphospho-decaprenol L-rhamnosyltransferase
MALALPATSTALHRAQRPPTRRGKKLARTLGAPRLSVVIVNYCQWEETQRLVAQLQAAGCARDGTAEVVIVDNHSLGHPLVRRLRRRRGVSLRRWGRNYGFARAVNEGCRLSQGQWLLLLNPDVTVADDFLDKVLAVADRLASEEPRAGVVGFQLRNRDGTRQFSSGPFPSLAGTVTRLALPRARRKYHCRGGARRCRVPWVTGCCLLLRRDCLESLGGLDEDFFLYYEDVDFCQRASALGWSVWYEPAVRVVHHTPLHGRTVPLHLRLVTRHALLTYATKHWPGWQVSLLAGLVALEARLRRHWAGWRAETAAAELFAELERMAVDLGRGHRLAARSRLDHIVRHEEHPLAS